MDKLIHVLYVEDNEYDVELLLLSIERYNFNSHLVLDIAGTIAEAIDMFSVEKHAGALIDWNLPDGEGTEVAHYIRAISHTLPILFLSGALTEAHINHANQYHPKACIEKDYNKQSLQKIYQLLC